MSLPRLLTPAFGLLNLAHFLQALGYTSMLLLPLYLDKLGANRATIGMIMAVGSIGSLCARPLIGWSLDAWGRRPTIFIGTGLLSLGMAGIGLVVDLGPMIYVVRVFIGVGIGALFTAYFTFAADLIPSERRTEGLALFGVSGLLPLMINPFATKLGIAPLDLRWFLPLIGVAVLVSLVPFRWIEEARPRAEKGSYRFSEALRSLGARPLWAVWLATILMAGQIGTFMSFVTVSATDRGFGNATSLWMTYALGAIAVRVLGGRLPDRIGAANIVTPALALYALSMLLAATAETPGVLLWAGFFGGLGHGYCFPVLTSQVISRTPDAHRGSGMSMFTALWGLTEIAITPTLGAFADAFGDQAMFALAAVAVACSLVLWATLEHRFGDHPAPARSTA